MDLTSAAVYFESQRELFVGGKDCRLRAVSDSPRTEALQRTRRRDEVGE